MNQFSNAWRIIRTRAVQGDYWFAFRACFVLAGCAVKYFAGYIVGWIVGLLAWPREIVYGRMERREREQAARN